MKAYLTSIGEKTTDIVAWKLEQLGYYVVLIGGQESWSDKYNKFLNMAMKKNQPCLRIDADMIPNGNIKKFVDMVINDDDIWLSHGETFCFYKNDLIKSGPVLYKPKAISYILKNFNKLDSNRPESSGARLDEVNKHFKHHEIVVGSHGFFQNKKHFENAIIHRISRNQSGNLDLQLADKLFNI